MTLHAPLIQSPFDSAYPCGREGQYVCWSRMQAEAGQPLSAIVERKERERRLSGGIFFWGVGNAPAMAIGPLARLGLPVPMIFSIMKSKPKKADAAPSRTLAWTRYTDPTGVERSLPASALVTSRGDTSGGAKTRHYALMCHSAQPLALRHGVPFDPTAFRNVGGAGAPVGASQVTALLRQVHEMAKTSAYEANLLVWLTGGYWVRLSAPVDLGSEAADRITGFAGSDEDWLALVERLTFRAAPAFANERLGLLI